MINISSKRVWTYAHMCAGRPENSVDPMKMSIRRIYYTDPLQWDEVMNRIAYVKVIKVTPVIGLSSEYCTPIRLEGRRKTVGGHVKDFDDSTRIRDVSAFLPLRNSHVQSLNKSWAVSFSKYLKEAHSLLMDYGHRQGPVLDTRTTHK